MKEKIEIAIVSFLLGAVIVLGCASGAFKRHAIAHGEAIYNPTNGNFMWKGEK